jgi:hypothetical protein
MASPALASRGPALRVVAIAAPLLAAACANPVLSRRYEHVLDPAEPTQERCRLLTTSGFAFELEEPSTRLTIKDLSERGQQSLLEQLGRGEKAETVLKLAGEKLGAAADAEMITERSGWKRRIVLSLDHLQRGAADRLARARLKLQLDPGQLRFYSWNRLETAYASVDLSRISHVQRTQIGVAGQFGTPGASATPEVRREDVTTEEQAIRQRYVALSGVLSEWEATILEEGVAGIDLTGNVVFDVEIRAIAPERRLVMVFANLRGTDRKPKPPGEVEMKIKSAYYSPGADEDLVATLSYDFVVRAVKWGGRTLPEGDDWVRHETAKCCKGPSFTLVDRRARQFTTWQLRRGPQDGREMLAIDRTAGSPFGHHPLVVDFNRSSVAYEFLSWLKESAAREVSNRALYLCALDAPEGGEQCRAFTPGERHDLQVTRVPWNYPPEDPLGPRPLIPPK